MFQLSSRCCLVKENWDDNLENAKMLRPELEQVDGFPAVSD